MGSQDTPNIQAPLGTIQGLPTNLGLNPESVCPSTPPTTSMSTRGPGQTEQNGFNAHASGQSQYMANYQASPPFNLGGPLNTNSLGYPVIPAHQGIGVQGSPQIEGW